MILVLCPLLQHPLYPLLFYLHSRRAFCSSHAPRVQKGFLLRLSRAISHSGNIIPISAVGVSGRVWCAYWPPRLPLWTERAEQRARIRSRDTHSLSAHAHACFRLSSLSWHNRVLPRVCQAHCSRVAPPPTLLLNY